MSKQATVKIPLKVIPNAHSNQIVGWENGELKVRIAAQPQKGDANDELIRFLAKEFGVSRSQLSLVSGHTSRHKRIAVAGELSVDLQKILKEKV